MPKLLLIGAKKNYNAEYFYSRAFTSLGYDVLHLNSYEGASPPFKVRSHEDFIFKHEFLSK